MTDNTLLGRCTVALKEALAPSVPLTIEQSAAARRGVAAVLEHLAAEMLVLNQRNDRLTVHELARTLTLEAAGELAGWDEEPDDEPEDDWRDHPSLTPEQRNPNLR